MLSAFVERRDDDVHLCLAPVFRGRWARQVRAAEHSDELSTCLD